MQYHDQLKTTGKVPAVGQQKLGGNRVVLLRASVLHRFRLVAGAMMLIFFLSACTFPHPTYVYTAQFIPDSLDLTFHPGDHLTLSWRPTPGSLTTKEQPQTVLIRASIIGPFTSMKAAMAVEDRKHHINPPSIQTVSPPIALATSHPDIHTDTWSEMPQTGTINFPQHMPAGYYLLVQVVFTNGHPTSTGIELIQVTSLRKGQQQHARR